MMLMGFLYARSWFFLGQWHLQSLAFSSEEVTKVADGTFTVKWEDPDGGPEESEVDPKDIRQGIPLKRVISRALW